MLRPLYPEDDLGPAAERLRLFLIQYWGGPTTYSDERGHPRLRMRHAPFVVDSTQRDRWLLHMRAALDSDRAPGGIRAGPVGLPVDRGCWTRCATSPASCPAPAAGSDWPISPIVGHNGPRDSESAFSPRWWATAVFYQVYPRSFADGNGDGTGDLIGVRERLGYLHDLGVDALWLSPFYRSPMTDGGYDVADPCDVDPMFGTLADFDAMLADAHALDIKVTVDIVPNHFSEKHVWFQAALAAKPGSPERARFIFRPGRGEHRELPPNNWPAIFGGPAWTRVASEGTPVSGDWYLHLFAPERSPTSTGRTPRCRPSSSGCSGSGWIEACVDGFRIDVAHGMAKPVTDCPTSTCPSSRPARTA